MRDLIDKMMAVGESSGEKEWSVSKYEPGTEKYLGPIEFQSDDGEYHTFEVIELPDRLVFGGAANVGFIESGYILKDGFSTDETLQELLADLETYYRDGKEYTSHIVVNDRM
jgi:hypothetical protein